MIKKIKNAPRGEGGAMRVFDFVHTFTRYIKNLLFVMIKKIKNAPRGEGGAMRVFDFFFHACLHVPIIFYRF